MSDIHPYRLAPFSRLTFMSLKARWSAVEDGVDRSWQDLVELARSRPKAQDPPACCAEARLSRRDADAVVEAALATERARRQDWLVSVEGFSLLNPLMRAWGIGPLSFTPCSLRCEEALRLAIEAAGNLLEVFERLGEQPSLWDSWRGVAILKTPVFTGDASTGAALRQRVQVRFLPAEEKHHPYGIVPWGVHGTEFPYLTRRESRRKEIAVREATP